MSRLKEKLRDKEYRKAHVGSLTRHWLAFQVRRLREQRGWSQSELAARAGMQQSTIARLENPNYHGLSLSTMLRLADAFDVAFLAQFVSFDELTERRADLSPEAMHVSPYKAPAP